MEIEERKMLERILEKELPKEVPEFDPPPKERKFEVLALFRLYTQYKSLPGGVIAVRDDESHLLTLSVGALLTFHCVENRNGRYVYTAESGDEMQAMKWNLDDFVRDGLLKELTKQKDPAA